MDEIDIASERYEAWLQNRIDEAQYQLGHAVSAHDGLCKNCAERLDDGRPYCNSSCRDDHQERIRLSRMNGKYRGG
jgi:hypothetical protein